jgi:tRNA (guanine-N(7)-)-methyltransferase subunit TRM82
MLHCAVSREDKTISLYDIPTATNEKEGDFKDAANESFVQLLPRAIHKMSKRCCGLVLTSIIDTDQSCQVILLAADFCGDITAFPVTSVNVRGPSYSTTGSSSASSRRTEKRLLLGHTASMITGIQLVTDDYYNDTSNHDDNCAQIIVKGNQIKQQQRILSSDRNGKVRVTSFPHTHIVEGYLLNHTSYITSMDATLHPNFGSLCLTSSGDGTIRLWDYLTCQQLAMFHHIDTEDVSNNDKSGVITNVSLQYDGRICIYLCDGSLGIHLLNIHQNKTPSSPIDPKFSFIQQLPEFQCPAQPIFAKILCDKTLIVLLKEPIYFMHVRIINNIQDGTTILEDISQSSALCNAIRLGALKYHIKVPSSIFEFDEGGRIKKLSVGLGHGGRKHCQPLETTAEEEEEHNQNTRRRRRRRKLQEDTTEEKQRIERENLGHQ